MQQSGDKAEFGSANLQYFQNPEEDSEKCLGGTECSQSRGFVLTHPNKKTSEEEIFFPVPSLESISILPKRTNF